MRKMTETEKELLQACVEYAIKVTNQRCQRTNFKDPYEWEHTWNVKYFQTVNRLAIAAGLRKEWKTAQISTDVTLISAR